MPAARRWGVERYGSLPCYVPELQHRAAWLQELQRRLEAQQAELAGSFVPAAFVTFDSRWLAVVAATALHRWATHAELGGAHQCRRPT
jgi:hypothetical protein